MRSRAPILLLGFLVLALATAFGLWGGDLGGTAPRPDAPASDPAPGRDLPTPGETGTGARRSQMPIPETDGLIPVVEPVGRTRLLRAQVLDALGNPLAGCRATLHPLQDIRVHATAAEVAAATASATAKSDADGRVRLEARQRGPFALTLEHRDYPPTVARARLTLEQRVLDLGPLTLHSQAGLVLIVRDGEGGRVAGARGTLRPILANPELPTSGELALLRAALADGEGRMIFYGVAPGAYLLEVEAPGFARYEEQHLQAGGGSERRIEMSRATPVRGVVRDATNRPLPGIEVRFLRDGHRARSEWTTRDGSFLVEGLTPDRYRVLALDPQRGSLELAVSLPVADGRLDLRFPPGRTLRGRLRRSRDGRPVSGAEIALRAGSAPTDPQPRSQRRRTDPAPLAKSDQDGAFALPDLGPGRIRLLIRHPDHAPFLSPPLQPGDEPLEISLHDPFLLSAHAVDSRGLGVEGVRVDVVPADYDGSAYQRFAARAMGRFPVVATRSGAGGEIRLRGCPDGSYRLLLRASGLATTLGPTFRARPGQQQDLGACVLAPAASIRGRVLGADGEGLATVLLRLDPVDGNGHYDRRRSAPDGGYAFDQLAAGTYEMFYHYPEEQTPGELRAARERSLVRFAVEPGQRVQMDLKTR